MHSRRLLIGWWVLGALLTVLWAGVAGAQSILDLAPPDSLGEARAALLAPGTHDADALALRGAPLDEAVPGGTGAVWAVEAPVALLVDGTAAQVRWRAALPPTFWVADGVPVQTVFTSEPDADGWQTTSVDLSFVRRGHALQLRPQTTPLLLDSATVFDNSARNIILAIIAAYLIGSLFGALLWALLRRLRVRSVEFL